MDQGHRVAHPDLSDYGECYLRPVTIGNYSRDESWTSSRMSRAVGKSGSDGARGPLCGMGLTRTVARAWLRIVVYCDDKRAAAYCGMARGSSRMETDTALGRPGRRTGRAVTKSTASELIGHGGMTRLAGAIAGESPQRDRTTGSACSLQSRPWHERSHGLTETPARKRAAMIAPEAKEVVDDCLEGHAATAAMIGKETRLWTFASGALAPGGSGTAMRQPGSSIRTEQTNLAAGRFPAPIRANSGGIRRAT